MTAIPSCSNAVYISKVFGIFDSTCHHSHEIKTHLGEVKDALLNSKVTRDRVERLAKEIFDNYAESFPVKNRKRYRARPLSDAERLLCHIFDESYRHAPDRVIAAHPHTPPYSRLKKALRIDLPHAIATVSGSPLFKIAVSTASIFALFAVGRRFYDMTTQLVTGRLIPLFINHTPLAVIRGGNAILNAKDYVSRYPLTVFLAVSVAKQALLWGPEIPYLTRAVEKIHLSDVYNLLIHAPEELFSFLLRYALKLAVVVWGLSQSIHHAFRSIAQSGENDRLETCRGREMWQTAIQSLLKSTHPDGVR